MRLRPQMSTSGFIKEHRVQEMTDAVYLLHPIPMLLCWLASLASDLFQQELVSWDVGHELAAGAYAVQHGVVDVHGGTGECRMHLVWVHLLSLVAILLQPWSAALAAVRKKGCGQIPTSSHMCKNLLPWISEAHEPVIAVGKGAILSLVRQAQAPTSWTLMKRCLQCACEVGDMLGH